ncbi:hypothetical protein [Komagataeibacter europaeus]|uniref:hypothetical protein n=1 Tax=Komagataeibacter europaeus TaxID=33995 RepID=UPI0002EEB263|nr:hypothetical protein [Komagataeibacter europaeus]GBQ38863.1 hypothetical protein AA18890_0279 [Komagataeibacter europaeus LMG 18890]
MFVRLSRPGGTINPDDRVEAIGASRPITGANAGTISCAARAMAAPKYAVADFLRADEPAYDPFGPCLAREGRKRHGELFPC